MSAGEVFPTWEQLLAGSGTRTRLRSTRPRHARTASGAVALDDGMSWREAAGWSTLAVSCCLAAGHWASQLLP